MRAVVLASVTVTSMLGFRASSAHATNPPAHHVCLPAGRRRCAQRRSAFAVSGRYARSVAARLPRQASWHQRHPLPITLYFSVAIPFLR